MSLVGGSDTDDFEDAGASADGSGHSGKKEEEEEGKGGQSALCTVEEEEEELWNMLCTSIATECEEVASSDPSKVGQKARVMMAFVHAVLMNGPERVALLWETYGAESVEMQVADLRRGIEAALRANRCDWEMILYGLEQNLVARAGLLIDLRLIPASVYEL